MEEGLGVVADAEFFVARVDHSELRSLFPVVRNIEADKEEYKAKICRAADMIGIKRRGFFFVTFLHTSLMLMMKALFFVEAVT